LQLVVMTLLTHCYFLSSFNTTKAVQMARIHQSQVELVTMAMAIPMTKKIKN